MTTPSNGVRLMHRAAPLVFVMASVPPVVQSEIFFQLYSSYRVLRSPVFRAACLGNREETQIAERCGDCLVADATAGQATAADLARERECQSEVSFLAKFLVFGQME